MSYIAKAALFCDRCGSRVDLDPKSSLPLTFSSLATAGTLLAGWMAVDKTHHLCPSCAGAYNAKRAETERELRELAVLAQCQSDC